MPMIVKNVCPCIGCVHCVWSNVSYVYWCKKKEQSIVQAHRNAAHRDGQWLIPCGKDMKSYREDYNGGLD